MYNRYIPQPDGTFRRSSAPDAAPPPQETPPAEPVCTPPPPPPPQSAPCQKNNRCAGSFLKNLLPQDLDTGDLIVILLLLLMAGESKEDQNIALLTLAIYLFL